MTELRMIRNDYPITVDAKKYNRNLERIGELEINKEYYGEFKPYGYAMDGELSNEFELFVYEMDDIESPELVVIEDVYIANKYFEIKEF